MNCPVPISELSRRLLDGTLEPERVRALEQCLKSDKAALREFAHLLLEHVEGSRTTFRDPPVLRIGRFGLLSETGLSSYSRQRL